MADTPTQTPATTLGVLQSIESLLRQIVARLPAAPAAVANDADLDGPHGDPVIKQKDPRDWKGDTMLNRRFSECPAEYLELVASRLDYFAEQAEREGRLTGGGKPVAPFNRRDAARARGWAKRIKAGWKPEGAQDLGFDDDPQPGAQTSAPPAGGFPSDLPPATVGGVEVPDDEIPF